MPRVPLEEVWMWRRVLGIDGVLKIGEEEGGVSAYGFGWNASKQPASQPAKMVPFELDRQIGLKRCSLLKLRGLDVVYANWSNPAAM